MSVVVISGTAQGLGRVCAESFIAAGHTVAGLDLVEQDRLAGLRPWQVDITDAGAVHDVFDQILEELGPPTACVTAAGVYPRSTLADATPDVFRLVFDVNVLGTVLVAQGFARTAVKDGSASLVTIASADGFNPVGMSILYSASKAAVINLTRGIAAELAADGIRVTGIAPGYIATDKIKALVGDKGLPADASDPEEIAAACLRLTERGGIPLATGQTLELRRSAIEIHDFPGDRRSR